MKIGDHSASVQEPAICVVLFSGSGIFMYCVLTDVGKIYCSDDEREECFWSSNDDGYVDLAMRMNKICALTTDGQLQCWNLF